MKKLITLLLLLALALPLLAQAASGPEYQTKAINTYEKALPRFYKSIVDKIEFSLGWKDGSDPAAWKEAGLKKAKEIMIPWEDNTEFNMEVIAEEKRDGYTAKKVVFNLTEDSRVLGLLLVPNQKKKDIGKKLLPAVLMLHDHGGKFTIGKEKMVMTFGDDDTSQKRLTESKTWASMYFKNKFPGDELAKRGYVVLSVDALGWGDRSVKGWKGDSQQSLASNFMNMGTSYAAYIALEDIRSAKFLASLPEVDKTKVAAVGFSFGAFRAWQLAALTDDITACVAECWMATMKGCVTPDNNQMKGQSAFTMLHPFIAKYLDYPDVAGLAAPKPMRIEDGDQDHLFPRESAQEAFDKIGKIYAANNAQDKYTYKFWTGKGHCFEPDMQEEAYSWLDKQFGR